MNVFGLPYQATPYLSPFEEMSSTAIGAGGFNPLSYLGTAEFLLNPPRGPQDVMAVGSPTQGSEPISIQGQSWGPTAASEALRTAMAGAPFGPWGMAIGGTLGYAQGKK